MFPFLLSVIERLGGRGIVSALNYDLPQKIWVFEFMIVCISMNVELKKRIEEYFKGDEEALPSILEAIMARKISGKHEDTDDELMDELRLAPVDDVKDVDFESDFEDEYSTDEEINDLYNAKERVVKEMMEDDEYFNMDDKKWNDMIREAIQEGDLRDMRECEEILEDMLHFDKLLPGIIVMLLLLEVARRF